jgi:hypothetical protein
MATSTSCNEYLEMLRAGALDLADSAREAAIRDNVHPRTVQIAIIEGATVRYNFYLSKIFAGHKGYEGAARDLIKEYGLPISKLEEALKNK